MDCSVTPPVILASETESCEGNPSQTPGLRTPKACKGNTEKTHHRGERWQPKMCSVCSCHRNETSACVSQPIKQPSHKHALINSFELFYRPPRGGGRYLRVSHGAKDAFHKRALSKYTSEPKNTSAIRSLTQRRKAHLVNACCTSKG